MTVALLASHADPASVNIRDHVLKLAEWRTLEASVEGIPVRESDGGLLLFETPRLHLECDLLDRALAQAVGREIDAILVLSKHKAASGSPSLTVHPIGNYRAAEFGGRAGALVPAAPALATRALRALAREARAARLPHAVTWEATHHGPYFETPTAFVEIGTTEAAWRDPALGALVARAVLDAARAGPALAAEFEPVVVAVGGSHYVPRATDIAKKRKVAVGHMIPGYQLDAGLQPEVAKLAATRTPEAEAFIVDDRGFEVDATPVLAALEEAGLRRARAEDFAELRP